MNVHVDASALRKTMPAEHAVRFVMGGSMTAMTGFVAHAFGPVIGGLFLAFPAILPASLTLVASHEGRQKAVAEAGGAILGAMALAALAATTWLLAPHASPVVTLGTAAAVWAMTAVLLWWAIHGRRE
jgi:hypothetical protein